MPKLFVTKISQCDDDSVGTAIPSEQYMVDLVGTSTSVQWLLDGLEMGDEQWRHCGSGQAVQSITLDEIGEGKGFVSRVYRVTIRFVEPVNAPYVIVLKIPSTSSLDNAIDKVNYVHETADDNVQEQHNVTKPDAEIFLQMLSEMHNQECLFYKIFNGELFGLPILKTYASKIWAPNLRQEGALLMPYLSRDDAVALETYDTLSYAQLSEAIIFLAKLNAQILLRNDNSWVEHFRGNQYWPFISKALASGADKTIAMKPGYFGENFEYLRPLFENGDYYLHVLTTGICDELEMKPMMVHGDFRDNNILWKTNVDGTASDQIAAVIDWQLVHAGCISEDFARLMVTDVYETDRRNWEDEMMSLYCRTLEEQLEMNKMAMPYTKLQLKNAYEQIFPYQALILVYMVPLMYKPNADAEQPIKEVLQDRRDLLLRRAAAAIEDSVTYAKRHLYEKYMKNI